MNIEEVRERSDDELRSLEMELRRNLWKARFDNHAGQLDDTSQIPKLRRDLARVHTVKTERTRVASQDGAVSRNEAVSQKDDGG